MAAATAVGGIDAVDQRGIQVQVLGRAVGKAAQLQQLRRREVQPALLGGLAHRRLQRCLARVTAALGDVPAEGAGGPTQQQLAARVEHEDAAAERLHAPILPAPACTTMSA